MWNTSSKPSLESCVTEPLHHCSCPCMFEVYSDHQREKQGAKNVYVFYNLSSPPESSIKHGKISLTGLTLWLPDGKGCLCTSLHPCVSSWPCSNINQRFKTTRLQLQTCWSGQLKRPAYHLNSPLQTFDFQSFLLLTLQEQNGGDLGGYHVFKKAKQAYWKTVKLTSY